jgi:putative ABC transport system permease protein
MIRAAWQALVGGPLRSSPGRTLLAVLAIACGIALGFSVHLVNASAAAEFRRAALQLAGEADLVIRGPRQGFDEMLYPRIAGLPGIAIASPALEFQASRTAAAPALKIIGIDALRARELQPALFAGEALPAIDLFDPDNILLSAAAARAFGVSTGDRLDFLAGTETVRLRVAAILPDGAYRQPLGIMDIAAAQWRFGMTGTLHRIDVRVEPQADMLSVQRSLQTLLPAGVHVLSPDAENRRSAALTRAYRTNLDMLALIALFTGAFVVYSTQTLAILRRRMQISLLRALGVSRPAVLGLLLGEGAAIGAAGGLIGIAAGGLLAHQLLAASGVDLGAGYFRQMQANLHVEPVTLVFFLLLGVVFAVIGTLAPALEISGLPPAQGLRAGDPAGQTPGSRPLRYGLAAIAGAALLLWLPHPGELPLPGYAAIALLLLGSVLVLPPVAIGLLRALPLQLPMPHALGLARLIATPRHVAISMSSILVSFSLVVAMLLMIHSFRTSLDTWLHQVLPADIHVRAASSGETGYLTPAVQQRITELPGLQRVEFLRSVNLLLHPQRPAMTLIARDPGDGGFARTLPLVDTPPALPEGSPPAAWISELVADVLQLRPGDRLLLPLGEQPQAWIVAGIWRDYARQNGAIVIDRADYIRLTGDLRINDLAAWLAPGVTVEAAADGIRHAIGNGSALDIADTRDIRRLSLAIFDRTFAVTWALQIAALAIGLLGVGLAFSAQALARRQEFGMLRHLGMTRREIAVMLAGEGALSSAVGALCGMACGGVIGLLLIRVINRQSFHWSMDLAVPWLLLPLLFCSIVLCAALAARCTAVLATRSEMTRAVREDW